MILIKKLLILIVQNAYFYYLIKFGMVISLDELNSTSIAFIPKKGNITDSKKNTVVVFHSSM